MTENHWRLSTRSPGPYGRAKRITNRRGGSRGLSQQRRGLPEGIELRERSNKSIGKRAEKSGGKSKELVRAGPRDRAGDEQIKSARQSIRSRSSWFVISYAYATLLQLKAPAHAKKLFEYIAVQILE